MTPQTPDPLHLHRIDAIDAFRMAIDQSGQSLPELAKRMEWSESMARRVFSPEKFYPSFEDLPKFCSTVGNTIILQWLMAKSTFYGVDEHAQAVDCHLLLLRVNDIFAEVGDVAHEARKAVEDNKLEAHELRALINELQDVLERGMALVGDLRRQIKSKPHG